MVLLVAERTCTGCRLADNLSQSSWHGARLHTPLAQSFPAHKHHTVAKKKKKKLPASQLPNQSQTPAFNLQLQLGHKSTSRRWSRCSEQTARKCCTVSAKAFLIFYSTKIQLTGTCNKLLVNSPQPCWVITGEFAVSGKSLAQFINLSGSNSPLFLYYG